MEKWGASSPFYFSNALVSGMKLFPVYRCEWWDSQLINDSTEVRQGIIMEIVCTHEDTSGANIIIIYYWTL